MLRLRVLTALIGIPLMLVAIFAPGGGLFGLSLSLLALIGSVEFAWTYRAASLQPPVQPNPVLLLAGACLPFMTWWLPDVALARILLPVFLGALLYELGRAWLGRIASVAHNIGYGTFGMLYIGWLFSFGVRLREDYALTTLGAWQVERGALVVLWLFAMLWMGDTAAYFVGKFVGRRKIATLISPAKTIEGFVANLILCVLIGSVGGTMLGYTPTWATVAGLGVGVLGQLGDLFESALKRAVGVKDFGRILPGHGGVLDRFDSFLFSAPWLWWWHQLA